MHRKLSTRVEEGIALLRAAVTCLKERVLRQATHAHAHQALAPLDGLGCGLPAFPPRVSAPPMAAPILSLRLYTHTSKLNDE